MWKGPSTAIAREQKQIIVKHRRTSIRVHAWRLHMVKIYKLIIQMKNWEMIITLMITTIFEIYDDSDLNVNNNKDTNLVSDSESDDRNNNEDVPIERRLSQIEKNEY